MHPRTLLATILAGAAAVACRATPASKPSAPVEVPIAKPSAAPPVEADAGAGDEEAPSGITEVIQKAFAGREKIRECNALIEVINEGVANLEHAPSNPNGVADFRQMADIMDAVTARVTKVKLTLPQLREYAATYRKMASEVAKAAREMAAAADAKDIPRLTSAQAAMDKAVRTEDPLVDEINKFCQGQ